MSLEELTQLIEYHTGLQKDAVTSGNEMLAAYHAGMAAAFQQARAPWVDPVAGMARGGTRTKKSNPALARLEELAVQLDELRGMIEHD